MNTTIQVPKKIHVIQNIREAKSLDDAMKIMEGMAANGWLHHWDNTNQAAKAIMNELKRNDEKLVQYAEHNLQLRDALRAIQLVIENSPNANLEVCANAWSMAKQALATPSQSEGGE